MRARLLVGIVSVALGAVLPGAASAYPTTWEFKGTVTSNDTSPGELPADWTVGSPVRVLLTFDTEIRGRWDVQAAGGRRFRALGEPLHMAVYLGQECNPCVPNNDTNFNQGTTSVILRDNYKQGFSDLGTDQAVDPPPVDGISLGLNTGDGYSVSVVTRDLSANFSPQVFDYPSITSNVSYPAVAPIPVTPDPRIAASMRTHLFQVCIPAVGRCMFADLDTVSVPTYGARYLLTARHCRWPDINTTGDFSGDDCVVAGGPQRRVLMGDGGLGWPGFDVVENPSYASPEGPVDTLGETFGSATFGSTAAAFPILRGRSVATDVGRVNSNLLSFQEYTYSGDVVAQLPLVVSLDYTIGSYAAPNPGIEEGLRPGGATLGTTLSIIDGNKVPAIAVGSVDSYNSLTCGNEGQLNPATGLPMHALPSGAAWPAGSILGTATYMSAEGEVATDPNNPKTALLRIVRCATPEELATPGGANADGTVATGEPITLAADQKFTIAVSMQTPSRGRWARDGVDALANGFADASNTLKVRFDPAAPPALVKALVQEIAPACTGCEVASEILPITVDVQPGSTTGCVNAGSNGVIPVALLGSKDLAVSEIRIETLKLNSLSVRVRAGKPLCAASNVNDDAYGDMVCHFQNQATEWGSGQTNAAVTGELIDGAPFSGSDSVCLTK